MKIVLDLDGTLLDPKMKQMLLLKDILKSYNICIQIDDFWQLKRAGMSTLDILKSIVSDQRVINKTLKIWLYNIEKNYYSLYDNLFPDALNFLNYLKVKKHKLYLLTARNNKTILDQTLARTGIKIFFDEIYCVDTKYAINNKSLILKGINADLFIGDSEVDLFSAKEADIEFIAVSTGQRSEIFLENKGANKIARDLNNILEKGWIK